MIRSLRVWHRIWFGFLAVLLPVLLLLALADRPRVPAVDALPTPGVTGSPVHEDGGG